MEIQPIPCLIVEYKVCDIKLISLTKQLQGFQIEPLSHSFPCCSPGLL